MSLNIVKSPTKTSFGKLVTSDVCIGCGCDVSKGQSVHRRSLLTKASSSLKRLICELDSDYVDIFKKFKKTRNEIYLCRKCADQIATKLLKDRKKIEDLLQRMKMDRAKLVGGLNAFKRSVISVKRVIYNDSSMESPKNENSKLQVSSTQLFWVRVES